MEQIFLIKISIKKCSLVNKINLCCAFQMGVHDLRRWLQLNSFQQVPRVLNNNSTIIVFYGLKMHDFCYERLKKSVHNKTPKYTVCSKIIDRRQDTSLLSRILFLSEKFWANFNQLICWNCESLNLILIEKYFTMISSML
jgi:hypothetical protein